MSHPIIWERDPLAAVMVAGNGSAMVYARPNETRAERWPLSRLRDPKTFEVGFDVVARLAAEPAVAFVAGEVEGGLRVVGAEGEPTFTTEEDGQIGYRRLTGDPLALGVDRVADEREWLEASWDAPFPDAPFQLFDQFRASRTGDCWWWPTRATTSASASKCRSTSRGMGACSGRTCRPRRGPAIRDWLLRSGRWICSPRCWSGSTSRCRRGSMASRSGRRAVSGR